MTRKGIGLSLSLCGLLLWSGSAFAANHTGARRGQQQHISQGYARGHSVNAKLGNHGKHRQEVVIKQVVLKNRPLRYSSLHGRDWMMERNVYRHKPVRTHARLGFYHEVRGARRGRPKPCPTPFRYTRRVHPFGKSFNGALSQPGVALSWNVLLD